MRLFVFAFLLVFSGCSKKPICTLYSNRNAINGEPLRVKLADFYDGNTAHKDCRTTLKPWADGRHAPTCECK